MQRFLCDVGWPLGLLPKELTSIIASIFIGGSLWSCRLCKCLWTQRSLSLPDRYVPIVGVGRARSPSVAQRSPGSGHLVHRVCRTTAQAVFAISGSGFRGPRDERADN